MVINISSCGSILALACILSGACYVGWIVGKEYGDWHSHHRANLRGWIAAAQPSAIPSSSNYQYQHEYDSLSPWQQQGREESYPQLEKLGLSDTIREQREQRKTSIILSASSLQPTRTRDHKGHLWCVPAPPVWLHPSLLAHRNPRRMIILTAAVGDDHHGDNSNAQIRTTIDRYIQEALKHQAVDTIDFFIVGNNKHSQHKFELPPTRKPFIAFHWITSEDFQLVDYLDNQKQEEWTRIWNKERIQMGEEGDQRGRRQGEEEHPIHIVFVDASITCQYSAQTVASWHKRLLPKQGIVRKDHPMMVVELGWLANSPRTAEYRYTLADKLSSLENSTEKSSSAVKMIDFDASHWLSIMGHDPTFIHRNYLVVFSVLSTPAFWHKSESEWNLAIHQQLVRPSFNNQDLPEYDHDDLDFLDSAVMSLLEYPSKHSEIEFCRRHPKFYNCRRGGSGFDPYKFNIQLDQLTVTKSRQGDHAGRGVFTMLDIPKRSYLGAENQHYARCRWQCNNLIQDMAYDWNHDKLFRERHMSIVTQFHGYGTGDQRWGRADYEVDTSLLLFVNHGCNGTYNINLDSDYHESNMVYPPNDLMAKMIPHGMLKEQEKRFLLEQVPLEFRTETIAFYLPIRHNVEDHASKSIQDIPAGEEILDNYMTYGGVVHGRDFWLNAKSLWEECRGSSGVIEQYQTILTESQTVPPQHQDENLVCMAPFTLELFPCEDADPDDDEISTSWSSNSCGR